MPEMAKEWTREMVQALPDDGNRYELFDGQLLVSPAPTGLHQFALLQFWKVLDSYVTRERLGWVMTSPADLHLGGGQLSQPDLYLISHLPADRCDWSAFPNPVLVIEILSPSTARFDRIVKRPRFQRSGIPEYWIVDLDTRAIERWRPGDQRPEIVYQRLTWHPERAIQPLDIDLPQVFETIWGTPAT